jgi:predicted metal-binding membrane protein
VTVVDLDDVPPDPDALDTARVIAVLERIADEQKRRHRKMVIAWTLLAVLLTVWVLLSVLAAAGFI